MGFLWRTLAPPTVRKWYWRARPVRHAEYTFRRRLYRKRGGRR